MALIKVQKGNTIKTIPAEYKGLYINAGWGEVKKPTNVGVSSSYNKNGESKD